MADYAQPPETVRLEDCVFYHRMDIPGVGVVGEQWDLRETVDAYLGNVEFNGLRVLEIGPASGYLTIEMERRGAEVVAVELPPNAQWNFVPWPDAYLSPIKTQRQPGMDNLRNGFWLNHAANNSKAKIVYADVCNLPDLGQFDIAVLASVLLHCERPVRIIAQCAKVARSILVTEMHFPELVGPVCRLHPSAANGSFDTWWDFSPDFFSQYLEVLGFAVPTVTFHDHLHLPSKGLLPMFSVVAVAN